MAITLSFGGMLGSPAVAEFPELCSRDGYALLDQCPTICAAACRDGSFNQGEAVEACDRLFFAEAEGKGDAAACAEGSESGWRARFADVPSLEAIRSQCAGTSPPRTGSIPAGTPLPECVVSLRNLTCRFEALGGGAQSLIEMVSEFAGKEFETLAGLEMCQAISQEELERYFHQSQEIVIPLKTLGHGFEQESICLEELRKWNAARASTCDATAARCEQRVQMLIEDTDAALAGNLAVAGKISTALNISDRTVAEIKSLWDDYRFLCF